MSRETDSSSSPTGYTDLMWSGIEVMVGLGSGGLVLSTLVFRFRVSRG